MKKNLAGVGGLMVAAAGGAGCVWHVWTSLCRLNGWNALGRGFWFGLLPALLVGIGFLWFSIRKYQREFSCDEREALQEWIRASAERGRKGGLLAGLIVAPLLFQRCAVECRLVAAGGCSLAGPRGTVVQANQSTGARRIESLLIESG